MTRPQLYHRLCHCDSSSHFHFRAVCVFCLHCESMVQIMCVCLAEVLTVQGCWSLHRWVQDSPPAAHTQCWHHSRSHSLKASSLLLTETNIYITQHSHVSFFSFDPLHLAIHPRCTCFRTYWLEVWGTRLWSVISTSALQHRCWEGRTSLGSSGRSLTRLWTTSCPRWDVSEKMRQTQISQHWETVCESP